MANAVVFSARGFKSMQKKLDVQAARMTAQATRFLDQESRRIMTEAKRRTPVAQQTFDRRLISGELRDSGTVDPVQAEPGMGAISVRLHFGENGAKEYALAVHEHPSSHDPRSWKGKTVLFRRGGPKFLEQPLMEAANDMATRLSVRMKL